MRLARHCECDVVTVGPEATCLEIADEMDRSCVGSVVVTDSEDAPLGIVTDRDLTERVVAADRDPKKTTAADVMSADPVTASPDDLVSDLLAQMRSKQIRRLPLVEDGRVVGIVTLDDVVMQLSSEIFQLSEAVWVELRESRRKTRTRRRRESREQALDELQHQARDLGARAREELRSRLGEITKRLGS